MIPLKLTVENFKSYRGAVPTLHLQGVHIACLCGANGHGKSSLLDAMAWALWGDAVHRPQEELVHVGEQNMRVELEFIAGGSAAGDARGDGSTLRPRSGQAGSPRTVYRVIRRYARGRGARAGATDLQLQVLVGQTKDDQESEAEFRSISGNSVRETEAAIQMLVGMDYTTFVNSAFLVQGRADEFTTKRPADRQRVLGEVLGLGLYDRLQECARQKTRSFASEAQRVEGQVQAWIQQLEQRPEHEAELPRVETDLGQVGEDLSAAEQELAATRERVSFLRDRRTELSDLQGQRGIAQEELTQLQAQKAQHERRLHEWEALASRENEIVGAFARLGQLRQRDEELTSLQVNNARLEERRTPLAQRVEALPTLELALVTAQQELGALSEREEVLRLRQVELQSLQVTTETFQAENQRLRREMEELRSKVDMLSAGDARCPLCGTELGVEGRAHITQEYEAQGKDLADKYRENQKEVQQLGPRHTELAAVVQRDEAEVGVGRRSLHGRIATLTQQVDEAAKAPVELESLEKEMGGLGYDPQAHQEIKGALVALASADEEHRRVQEATRGLPQEWQNLERVTALAARRTEAISQVDQRMVAAQAELPELPAQEQRLLERESRWTALRERHQLLVARRGFLEERLREYRDTEKSKAESEAALQTLAQEREVYEQLATAFGRTGVQALLVEAAIPEIEAEANRLLGRMTDNTMHLRLETQRETQRGGSVETLEIKVADALATRSYETFSGGEAFRINLALRIALSKLLAHRAGAPLPTLFIDEGFGTQDAAGRERILDVLQSISDDFECILVITHMDEVKDAFPVRIEVQKTDAGSTFALT